MARWRMMSPSWPPQLPVYDPPRWYQLVSQPDITNVAVDTQPAPVKLHVSGAGACAQPAWSVWAALALATFVLARLLDQTQLAVVQLTGIHWG